MTGVRSVTVSDRELPVGNPNSIRESAPRSRAALCSSALTSLFSSLTSADVTVASRQAMMAAVSCRDVTDNFMVAYRVCAVERPTVETTDTALMADPTSSP